MIDNRSLTSVRPGVPPDVQPGVRPARTGVTVWYDGSCPLCVREIALMRRLDRSGVLTFVDVAGDGACPIDRADLLARFHAQEAGGAMVSGAAAFAAMWRAIPLLRPLGLAARNPVVLSGLEHLYMAFLRVRPRLQRWISRFFPLPPRSKG